MASENEISRSDIALPIEDLEQFLEPEVKSYLDGLGPQQLIKVREYIDGKMRKSQKEEMQKKQQQVLIGSSGSSEKPKQQSEGTENIVFRQNPGSSVEREFSQIKKIEDAEDQSLVLSSSWIKNSPFRSRLLNHQVNWTNHLFIYRPFFVRGYAFVWKSCRQ